MILNERMAALCFGSLAAILFNSAASAQTDQDRMNDFHACIDKSHDENMKYGSGLLINGLTGNFIKAAGTWAGWVIWAEKNHPDCYAMLSPAQRAAIAREMAAVKEADHEEVKRGGKGPLK